MSESLESLAPFLAPDRTVSFWDQLAAQVAAAFVRACHA